MRYMNDCDIAYAIQRFDAAEAMNRLKVARTVARLAEWANTHSDGWAYWPKPARAANKAMALVESRTRLENEAQEEVDATDAEVRAAFAPIKAFCTRQIREQHMTAAERDQILGVSS